MKTLILFLALLVASFGQITKVGGSGTTKVGGSGATKVSPVAASSKTPSQVSGLIAWYDDSLISGSDGDAITTQTDSSGTGNTLNGNATLKTGANGKNGLNVALFNGTSDQLQATFSQNQTYSMFIVFQVQDTSTALNNVVIRWGTGCELQIDNGGLHWDPQCGNGTDRTIGSAVDTSWHIMGFIFNGASSQWRIDGGAWTTFATNPGTTAITQITLGSAASTAFLNCKFGETAIYSNGVSTTGGDGDALFNGFNTKWAVY